MIHGTSLLPFTKGVKRSTIWTLSRNVHARCRSLSRLDCMDSTVYANKYSSWPMGVLPGTNLRYHTSPHTDCLYFDMTKSF